MTHGAPPLSRVSFTSILAYTLGRTPSAHGRPQEPISIPLDYTMTSFRRAFTLPPLVLFLAASMASLSRAQPEASVVASTNMPVETCDSK